MRINRTVLVAGAVAALILGGSAAAYAGTSHKTVNAADLAASKFVEGKVPTVTPLATNCDNSKLPTHNGFQESPACVKTEDGEVSAFDKNPTLAFVNPPDKIRSGRDFTLQVSTRNLVRDRFLGAAAGGYYLETSLLVQGGANDGLTRGHYHLGCQVVSSNGKDVKSAPIPSRSVFFKAVEDGKGGVAPDTTTVTVTGVDPLTKKVLFQKGDTVQCAAWAGDGSHRTPMMTFANEIPAFDSVRLDVKGHDW